MREIGNTICFTTSYNRPKKHDGDEFVREMEKFTKLIEGNFENCYMTKPTIASLRKQFNNFLIDSLVDGDFQKDIHTFIFFMHGSWKWLYGIDHNIWTTHRVAQQIKKYAADEPLNIVLYACGCGGGKGKWKRIHEYKLGSRWDMRGEFGFAMRLANDLSETGIHNYRIFAHIGSGHVTKRPFCVWITEEENEVIKRRVIVPYHSWASPNRKGRRQWLRWVKFIQETKTGRFEAPFLTDDELTEIIGG